MPEQNLEQSIFLQAIELAEPTDRAAYLDEACRDDPRLRAELDALLAAHNRLGGAPLPPRQPEAKEAPAPATVASGAAIGPYKLLEQIGEGGMGVVYMAQQMQPLQRKVALKIVKPGMDSRMVIARFEAERQALAIMDHTNIAKVLDAGTTETGSPYFAMELVKGIPVTKYADQQRLTLRERLALFIPICQAVQHAHRKGVIHRDIKPTNVLVALYDGVPVPKVIDFGVAKAMDQKLTAKTLFTGFGQLIGTLEYMSPEQAQFNQLDIDTRSDIYSLGVLLYELLTGTTPFEQARRATVALDETLRIIREVEPPKPSTKISTAQTLPTIAANRNVAPTQLRRQMTGDLDWIVMKCLEKDRNRRYETASSLASDIQHYLHGEPVLACPPSVVNRVKKYLFRHKGSAAVASGLLMGVVVAAAAFGWAIRDRAAREWEFARVQSDRRATVQREARNSFDAARALIVEGKLAAAREKLVEARTQFGIDSLAFGSVIADVEAGQAELDRFQQFLDLIDRANQAETAPTEPEYAIPAHSASVAAVRDLQHQSAAAVPWLLEALEHYSILDSANWQRALDRSILATPQSEQIRRNSYEVLLWLADDLLRRKQDHRSEQPLTNNAAAGQALVYLEKAENIYGATQAFYVLRARCREALGDDSAAQADKQQAAAILPAIAYDHFLRGLAAFEATKLKESVEAFEAALRVEPTHYWSLMKLGNSLSALGGRPEVAASIQILSGCILKRPDHAHAYYCRAYSYDKLGRNDEALSDFSRAIELDSHHVGAWYFRGVIYGRLRQFEQAVANYSMAIELDPNHAYAWYARGVASFALGQRDQALADYSRAIELKPKLMSAWQNRAALYELLGQPELALADYSQAIELNPKYALSWYNRGRWYQKAQQQEKALADYSKSIELFPSFALAWYGRGLAYDRLHQPDKALPDFTRAIELNPTYKFYWFTRGGVHNRLNRPDKALADFSKAIELDPNFASAWNDRGDTFKNLNQPREAIADYLRTLELAPTRTVTLNNLAWLLVTCADENLRNPKRAVELAARAVELAPSDGNYFHTLGVAQYRNGDWMAAVGALERAVELRGGDASERLFLAVSYWKLGQQEHALAAYEDALQWLQANKERLETKSTYAAQLWGIQKEAADVLGQNPCKL